MTWPGGRGAVSLTAARLPGDDVGESRSAGPGDGWVLGPEQRGQGKSANEPPSRPRGRARRPRRATTSRTSAPPARTAKAAWKHQDAGNGDKANCSRAQGQRATRRRPTSGYQAKSFADGQARNATRSRRRRRWRASARTRPAGRPAQREAAPPGRPGGAQAGADAYKLAGCDREQLFHQAKAESHDSMGGALKVGISKP